jgi:hypothetical protein
MLGSNFGNFPQKDFSLPFFSVREDGKCGKDVSFVIEFSVKIISGNILHLMQHLTNIVRHLSIQLQYHAI